jgi:hypothetical protein
MNLSKEKVIGYMTLEKTTMSLSRRLMDEFPGIKLERTQNDGHNESYPVNKYPFMLVLKSNEDINKCKKIKSDHFVKFSKDKTYRNKYYII